MTAAALAKARGSRWPVRHDEALEGLSDAGQWVLDILLKWRQRDRGRQQHSGPVSACARRQRYPRQRDRSEQQPFWKE